MNKNYVWPYNLAFDIFEGSDKLRQVLPFYLEDVLEVDLTERERLCIYYKYKDGETLQEIADHFNVTRERIRQILAKALRKLRNPSRTNKFLAAPRLELIEARCEIQELNKIIESLKEVKDIPKDVKVEEIIPVLATPIMALDLSVRSYNCLVRKGINTIGDLQNFKIVDFMKIRNLGLRSFHEIMEKLSEIGFAATNGEITYPLGEFTDPFSTDKLIFVGEAKDETQINCP